MQYVLFIVLSYIISMQPQSTIITQNNLHPDTPYAYEYSNSEQLDAVGESKGMGMFLNIGLDLNANANGRFNSHLVVLVRITVERTSRPQTSSLNAEDSEQLWSRAEGILAYQNGVPFSIKQYMFVMTTYTQLLGNFYNICKKTYTITFNISNPIQSYPFSQPIIQTDSQHCYQKYIKQIEDQSRMRINSNMENLKRFLGSIGCLSPKDKGINRYKQIRMKCMINRKLQEIIRKHENAQIMQLFAQPKANKCTQPNQNKQKHQNEQSKIQKCKVDSKISDQTQTSQKPALAIPSCCLQQTIYDQNHYPQVDEKDCPIKKLANVEIIGQNQQFGQQQGGYFIVTCNDATVEKYVPQNRNSQQQPMQAEDQERESRILQQSEYKQQQMQQKYHNYPKQKQTIQLAIKSLKPELLQSPKHTPKISSQLQIISHMGRSPYVAEYYITPEQEQWNGSGTQLLMQPLVMSLKQVLTNQLYFCRNTVILELLNAVIMLHRAGIVHRDVKPGNVMFDKRGQLKIIDFSQSLLCYHKYHQAGQYANVGFTLPYSPIQCSRLCDQGYANFKIDNWAVGMTIAQVILGALPVSYCKSMMGTIKTGWLTDQFNWCFRMRANNYNNLLLLPIKILCLKLMNIDSKKRYCLNSMLELVKFYHQFVFQL